ncbi:hypothetical protein OAF13_02960 [Akkermansiaceae bacterium]|nr:hypothetical protein [Akkermansiaceae bacterium]MDB4730990.1 hypothetical protein [Akkermansiaceae bacterium]
MPDPRQIFKHGSSELEISLVPSNFLALTFPQNDAEDFSPCSLNACFFGDSRTDTRNFVWELGGSLGDSHPGQSFSNRPTRAKYLDLSVQTVPQADGHRI